MRTFRNLSFVCFIAVALISGTVDLPARSFSCPTGCTCSQWETASFDMFCGEEVYCVDACSEFYDECRDNCSLTTPGHIVFFSCSGEPNCQGYCYCPVEG